MKVSCKYFGLIIISMFTANPAMAGDPFAGSAIYAEYCVSCHGGDGAGEIAGTPSFRGGRLMAKPHSELVNKIKYGKDLMPSFSGVLSDQQIDDVMAYIRTFN
ncbi:MAG: cytochrome c [Gammaproteobacteria bacterium]